MQKDAFSVNNFAVKTSLSNQSINCVSDGLNLSRFLPPHSIMDCRSCEREVYLLLRMSSNWLSSTYFGNSVLLILLISLAYVSARLEGTVICITEKGLEIDKRKSLIPPRRSVYFYTKKKQISNNYRILEELQH